MISLKRDLSIYLKTERKDAIHAMKKAIIDPIRYTYVRRVIM